METVQAQATTELRHYPTMRGYSAGNLWRMSQFFETYRDEPRVARAVAKIVLEQQTADFRAVQEARGLCTAVTIRRPVPWALTEMPWRKTWDSNDEERIAEAAIEPAGREP